MNEAAKLVSESVLGEDFITETIAGEPVTIYTPNIKAICRGLRYFSQIEIGEEYNDVNILGEILNNQEVIIKGLSELIAGDCCFRKYRALCARRLLRKATNNQIRSLWERVLPLLGGEDFFAYALSMKSATQMIAKPK